MHSLPSILPRFFAWWNSKEILDKFLIKMRDGWNNWKWGIFLLVHTFIKYGASFEKEKTSLRALIGCKRGKSGKGWITFYQESDAAAVKEGINTSSNSSWKIASISMRDWRGCWEEIFCKCYFLSTGIMNTEVMMTAIKFLPKDADNWFMNCVFSKTFLLRL